MAITIKLPAEEVEELVYDSVEERIVDTTRWDIVYESIVEYEGSYWRVGWSTGATEHQDYSSFRGGWGVEPEPLELTKVVKKQVVKEVWVDADE